MKTSAVRATVGLMFFALDALPARAQFIYPPVLVVPPPAQNYIPKPKTPDKPKPADAPPAQVKGGHYEGRTWLPD